jgi:hypothetical protein
MTEGSFTQQKKNPQFGFSFAMIFIVVTSLKLINIHLYVPTQYLFAVIQLYINVH